MMLPMAFTAKQAGKSVRNPMEKIRFTGFPQKNKSNLGKMEYLPGFLLSFENSVVQINSLYAGKLRREMNLLMDLTLSITNR